MDELKKISHCVARAEDQMKKIKEKTKSLKDFDLDLSIEDVFHYLKLIINSIESAIPQVQNLESDRSELKEVHEFQKLWMETYGKKKIPSSDKQQTSDESKRLQIFLRTVSDEHAKSDYESDDDESFIIDDIIRDDIQVSKCSTKRKITENDDIPSLKKPKLENDDFIIEPKRADVPAKKTPAKTKPAAKKPRDSRTMKKPAKKEDSENKTSTQESNGLIL